MEMEEEEKGTFPIPLLFAVSGFASFTWGVVGYVLFCLWWYGQ